MRVATMVLGLILIVLVGMQSCAVSFGGAMGDSNRMEQGGALGILVALLFLVGAAFALAFPMVSLASFTLAGLLGLAGGSTTPFTDLTVWGIVSLVLAVLSYFGWREKRKRRAERQSRVV
jgi:membrane protein implicated in regulation of membrane protease activity